jgi:hypothetical protein
VVSFGAASLARGQGVAQNAAHQKARRNAMATLKTRFTLTAPTILAATLALSPAPAMGQDEEPAASETAEPAPAAESAPAAEAPAPAPAGPAEPAPVAETAAPAAPAETAAPAAPPAPTVEWKAQTKGGLILTDGNSQSKNFALGVNVSRKEGNNKLAIEGGLAYGTSNNTVVKVDSNTNTIYEVDRQEVVSTNNWLAKGRYDRFLSANNAAYGSGQAAGDKIAGKSFFGGGQVGYSRQVLKDKWNILVAEIGYDFSHERYVSQPGKTLDPVTIHSARILVGETLSITKQTGVTASVEALFNLNKENKAINVSDGTVGVKAFKDTRANCKVALTTELFRSLSFSFGFTFKYDQNPAPRPVPSTAPAGTQWPSDYWRLAYARTWDTLTEATLIYTFF